MDFNATLASLGIKTTAATNAAASAPGKGSTTLGQADFLKLMTAQMKNQDPFNPTDNTQMIAQMAQFSSVAGISEMNSTLQSIATKLNAGSAADALAYVGKTVLTEGSVAYPRASGGLAGAVELDGDTTATSVTIADRTGNIVRQIALGAQKGGTVSYDWDGTDSAGAAVSGGPFTVTVAADKGGATVAARSLVWAPVESVALSGAEPLLSVSGLGSIKISAVRSAG